MKLTSLELLSVACQCQGLHSISHLYEELQGRYSNMNAEELRELFLWSICELMKQGRLKFLGEGWIQKGEGTAAELMFGDKPFGPDDIVADGLRQAPDPSPEGVVKLIRAKWPIEQKPAFNTKTEGFPPLWFEKWYFTWCDENGRPVSF